MKCCAGGEQGAINSAQRVREDFKKKVTLALKKAAEIWRVGVEVAGKRHSKQREQQGQRQPGVNACGLACRTAPGAVWLGRGVCQQERVVTLESASGPSLQRAALAGLRSLGPGLQHGKCFCYCFAFLKTLLLHATDSFLQIKVFMQIQYIMQVQLRAASVEVRIGGLELHPPRLLPPPGAPRESATLGTFVEPMGCLGAQLENTCCTGRRESEEVKQWCGRVPVRKESLGTSEEGKPGNQEIKEETIANVQKIKG